MGRRATRFEVIERLIQEMVDKGWTQKEMAARHGHDPSWMCRRVKAYGGAIVRHYKDSGDAKVYEEAKALWSAAMRGTVDHPRHSGPRPKARHWDREMVLATMRAEGLTRQQACQRWGMSYRTLSRWLAG